MVEKTALSTEYCQLHRTCDLEKATICTVEVILLSTAEEGLLEILHSSIKEFCLVSMNLIIRKIK